MTWLIIILFAYFLFALTALGDKYILSGPPNPKSYAFYIGIFGILTLVLIPFINFSLPETSELILALLAGFVYVFALLGLFFALENFETSRVVPAIGGILPLFSFGLVFLFSGDEPFFSLEKFLAFFLLLSGSVLSTLKKEKGITWQSLRISVVTAFLFGLTFVLTKYVYLVQPFWSGFVLMRIGGFLAALFLFFSREIKREILGRKFTFQKKSGIVFLFNQALGGGAFILQNWAIALVPLSFLPFINALEGTKYVFLLIFASFLSLKFPKILKEETGRGVLIKKIIAIILIIGGLFLLAF